MFWKKKAKAGGLSREVVFDLVAPAAKKVLLAAEFTAWDQNPLPCTKTEDGRWTTSVPLKPGCYEYRYIVDETWQSDPCSRAEAPNPFGSTNSIIAITENE